MIRFDLDGPAEGGAGARRLANAVERGAERVIKFRIVRRHGKRPGRLRQDVDKPSSRHQRAHEIAAYAGVERIGCDRPPQQADGGVEFAVPQGQQAKPVG